MDMQGEDEGFLSDILNGGDGTVAGLEDLDFGQTQDTQVQQEVQATKSTKGTKRTKNFHWKEDETICSAWLNVSKDPIVGANQTRSSLWGKVHYLFEKNKKTTAVRTESSIMHRWLTIQYQVNKFCACYEAILRRNQSGCTIDDKISEAKKLYVEWDKDKKSFGLLHCYTLLKGEDKWKAKMIELAEIEKEKQANKKKQKTSTKGSRPRDDEVSSEDQVIEVDSESPEPRKRSDGIKKAKANLRGGGGKACMEAFGKMMAEKKAFDMEKEKAKEERFRASLELEKATFELDKKRVAIEEKKAEAEEKTAKANLMKEEKEIMLADMSYLNPIQREWLEKTQLQIVERMHEN